jgi:sugar phosphate isomerase/epimerase
VAERLESAAPYIATVQLSDWTPDRVDDRRSLPGEGQVPLESFVQALQRGGYRGDFEIDVWSASLWKNDVETWLNDCTEACRRLVPGTCAPALG